MEFDGLIKSSGARLGALVDAVLFALMLGVWYVGGAVQTGTHTADTGAMSLWAPLLFGLTLLFCAVLSAASAILGAVAGYWAERTRSPLVGALVGLSSSVLATGVVVVLFPGTTGHVGGVWLDRVTWLGPPAVVAGIVVGFLKSRGA